MTAVDQFLAGKPPEPARDQWGRYRIPHPETGKVISWTRATTWASTIADTFALTNWKVRMAAVGLARRSDLLMGVVAVEDPDSPEGKKRIDKLTDAAMEHAGSSVRATLGTALHSITEAHDAGRDLAAVPAPYDADLAAYIDAVAGAGLIIDLAHIERIVCIPELVVAGTFDRLVTLPDGRTVVADLKTGRDLSYSWTEIAIQLALYAHATTIYDVGSGQHQPMPTVDRDHALVMHLPVGEARCDLYMVDIAAGWQMASVCGTVRDWRKRRNLAAPYLVKDRSEWISDRLKIIAKHADAKSWVVANWPVGCPPKPPWTDDQTDAIAAVLTDVEALIAAPFHNGDPAKANREPSRYDLQQTNKGATQP